MNISNQPNSRMKLSSKSIINPSVLLLCRNGIGRINRNKL